MALGALPAQVLRAVIGETLALVGLGIACGLPAALAAARLLKGFLYGVKPADPAVTAWTTAMVLALGIIAGSLPAIRAARIDPVAALRDE